MRRIAFALVIAFLGLGLLLLGPTIGQTQPPGGGGFPGMGGGFRMPEPEVIWGFVSRGRPTITISEMRMGREDMEAWAQKNGISNGQLTRDQFLAYARSPEAMAARDRMMARMGGGRPGGTPPSAPGSSTPGAPPAATPSAPSGGFGDNAWIDERFRRQDRNGDGFLSYEELTENLRPEREKWDTNKDGQIDNAEWREYVKAYMEQRREEWTERSREGDRGTPTPETTPAPVDLNRKTTVFRAGKLPSNLPFWFNDCDADKDAQVALYEWKEKNRSFEEFRNMDLNRDGFITVDELVRGKLVTLADTSTTTSSSTPPPASTTMSYGTSTPSTYAPPPSYAAPASPQPSGDWRSRMGGGGFDPARIFAEYANGKPTITITEIRDGDRQRRLAEWAQRNGVTNGQITQEQFAKYLEERMSRFRFSR